MTYSVVAFDLAGNAGPPGSAKPLRAALLRKLTVANLRIASVTLGARRSCASRARSRTPRRSAACASAAARGAPAGAKAERRLQREPARAGSTPVTLSLRDALGRVKRLTLRVP